jgi:tetratricopeptide (TPR) repeat protein
VRAGDYLHWTSPAQNWNHMCADCHSTDLRKNYIPAADSFATTWSEINVACEACHGPGSHHVAWAETREARYGSDPAPVAEDDNMGLVKRLRDRDGGQWVLADTSVTAVRVPPRTDDQRIETCAPCHSRRLTVHAPAPGDAYLDNHRLALLTEDLYWPDGQVKDEVYVYGSFLQSRMFHAGVTCSDCHDPHSLSLGFTPDMACNKCHLPSHFASTKHHFHKEGSPESSCASCHMPKTTYMVVDPRSDHSIRIPRPDLTLKIGVPNACNQCHQDKSVEWAVQEFEKWYGPQRGRQPHPGEAMAAGFGDSLNAESALLELVENSDLPVFLRASALLELGNHLSPRSLPGLRLGLRDAAALMRFAAVQATQGIAPEERFALLQPLLDDPIRLVRAEAASRLAAANPAAFPSQVVPAYERALAEYEAMQHFNADRAESHLNLGVLALQEGDTKAAERAYLKALELSPAFTEAAINLADLYRHTGRELDCGAVLERALQREPDHAAALHALGLQRFRMGRKEEAMDLLQRAVQSAPRNARYAYVYGVALHSLGQVDSGIEVLEDAHRAHPADLDVLMALTSFLQQDGQLQRARRHAETLQRRAPGNPQVEALVQQLNVP